MKGDYYVVPGEGLEPSQYHYRRILSPLRLPIPPSRLRYARYPRELGLLLSQNFLICAQFGFFFFSLTYSLIGRYFS